MGYSHTNIKLNFKSETLGVSERKEADFIGLIPNLSIGYKYENFLASLTLESGNLKKDKAKIKQNNMLGLVNLDYLLGTNNIFAILGVGLSNYKMEIEEFEQYSKEFGIGAVLRAGVGSTYRINNDTYLFANALFKYSLKNIEYTIDDNGNIVTLNFNNLFSFGANIGVAF
ncbi:MAG: hypothetical protein ACTTIC_04575 [Helicobacteraceae bacterium]